MEEIIRRTVMNRKMWTKDGRKIDLRKLASEMMNRSDLQISCNCPAFLYWGSDYILSRPKRDAKYGPPEHRRPKIRNPREYGSMCKHLDAMMKTYPFYRSTMAKYLHEFWGNLIAQIEEEAKKEREGFKKASAELKRKKEEEAAPPTAEEPTAEEEASPEEETTKESLNIKEAKGLFLRTSKDQTGPVFGMNPNSILLRAFDNEDLAVEYARRNELAGWITTYVSSVEYKKATRQDFVKSQKLFKLEQEIRRLEQEFEEDETNESKIVEDEFDDLFEPVSDKEAKKRISGLSKKEITTRIRDMADHAAYKADKWLPEEDCDEFFAMSQYQQVDYIENALDGYVDRYYDEYDIIMRYLLDKYPRRIAKEIVKQLG
jgi:hypothetical protein